MTVVGEVLNPFAFRRPTPWPLSLPPGAGHAELPERAKESRILYEGGLTIRTKGQRRRTEPVIANPCFTGAAKGAETLRALGNVASRGNSLYQHPLSGPCGQP